MAAIAAALAFVVTLPAMTGRFVWDDLWLIVQSPVREDPSRLLDLLVHGHGWGVMVDPEQPSGYFRPLAALLHGLVLIVAGARPWGFRLLQSLLFAASAFLLARWLTGRSASDRAGSGERMAPSAAWGALLFAAHPALADAFGWVSAMPDLLAAALLFATLLCLDRPVPRPRLAAGLWLLALLSKESALAGLGWFVVLGVWRWRGAPGRDAADTTRLRATAAWMGGALAVYLGLRFAAIGLSRPAGEWPPGVEASGAVLVGKLLLYNLRVILWPLHLTVAPPVWVTGIGPAAGIGAEGVLGWAGLAIGAALAAWAVWAFVRESRWRQPALGILLMLVALLPVLQIVPSNDLAGGRFLVLPVAGLAAGAGAWLAHLPLSPRTRSRAPAVLLAVLVLAMAVRSGVRAAEWRDEERLFGGEYRRQPSAVRAAANWGGWLLRAGRTDEARPVIEELSRRQSAAPPVRLLRALLDLQDGKIDAAEPVFEELLSTWRRTPTLVANLAACRLRSGRYEEGLALLDEATRDSTPTAGMRNNRALALQMLGRHEEALAEFAAAVREDPAYQPARVNRIRLLVTQGHSGAARDEGREFLRRFPASPHGAAVRAVLDTLDARSR